MAALVEMSVIYTYTTPPGSAFLAVTGLSPITGTWRESRLLALPSLLLGPELLDGGSHLILPRELFIFGRIVGR